MGKRKVKMGAGVILMSFDNGMPKILGLIGDEYHRSKHGAMYDLPKGTEDLNESSIDCALRETFEETGISIKQNELIAGPMDYSFLTMWVAEVSIFSRIIIEKNPITGKFEHEGFKWLTEKEALDNVYPYLAPFVKWAFTVI